MHSRLCSISRDIISVCAFANALAFGVALLATFLAALFFSRARNGCIALPCLILKSLFLSRTLNAQQRRETSAPCKGSHH